MTEAEHTPGPWKAREFGIHAPSKWTIAFIETDSHITLDGDFDEPLALANARFIAAAPDMEKALEMYIQAEDSEIPSVEQFAWAGDAARAALAKAKGETDA